MSEWNGRLIKDMTTQHIVATLGFLRKRAHKTCARAGGSSWRLYVETVYFDLEKELSDREANF